MSSPTMDVPTEQAQPWPAWAGALRAGQCTPGLDLLGCPGPTSTTTGEGGSAHRAPGQTALGVPAKKDGQTETSTTASHGNWGAGTGSPEVQEQSKGATWLFGGASLPSCPALRGSSHPRALVARPH